jgi:recombinational DNA repair ATPase RecF
MATRRRRRWKCWPRPSYKAARHDQQLQLKNFTAFTDLDIDFSPGINIIIGENGTGKTQLLKAILALSGPEARAEQPGEQLARKLCRLYHPLSGQVASCVVQAHVAMPAQRHLASGQEVTAKFSGTARSQGQYRHGW